MADNSLITQIMTIDTNEHNYHREIENHHKLRMIANNQSELVNYTKRIYKQQQEIAIANLKALSEIYDQNTKMAANISNQLDCLQYAIEDGFSSMTQYMNDGFENVAAAILDVKNELIKINSILSKPYETQVNEIMKTALKAVSNGIIASGSDQQADFEDAYRLFKEVLQNPIGSRNCMAWLQKGWLEWKKNKDYKSAAEAFSNAVRLSKNTFPILYLDALRHNAYMHYKMDDNKKALEIMQNGIKYLDSIVIDNEISYDFYYDYARYLSKTGMHDEALIYIQKCIDIRPNTIVTMFSEEDFMI